LIGSIGPLAMFILRIIPSTRDAGKAISWIFRLIPSFAFGDGVLSIASRSLFALLNGTKETPGPFDLDIAGGSILFLALFGVIYFALVFGFETLKNTQGWNSLFSSESSIPYVKKEYDDDV